MKTFEQKVWVVTRGQELPFGVYLSEIVADMTAEDMNKRTKHKGYSAVPATLRWEESE